ncbi:2994_t:CDS:2, partial [Cetraspora pellucida]
NFNSTSNSTSNNSSDDLTSSRILLLEYGTNSIETSLLLWQTSLQTLTSLYLQCAISNTGKFIIEDGVEYVTVAYANIIRIGDSKDLFKPNEIFLCVPHYMSPVIIKHVAGFIKFEKPNIITIEATDIDYLSSFNTNYDVTENPSITSTTPLDSLGLTTDLPEEIEANEEKQYENSKLKNNQDQLEIIEQKKKPKKKDAKE